MARLLTALLLVYLSLDSSAASLPGAFTFDIEDSVEVVRLERSEDPVPPTLTSAPEPLVVLVTRDTAQLSARTLGKRHDAPRVQYRARATLAASPRDAG